MTKDMTQGSPMKLILGFCIPLLLGNLFQQFYSMVDTIIVGRYLGVGALASVGSTGSINFLIIGFCSGVCAGFSIPISQKFGAKDFPGLRRFVANSVWLAIVFAFVMTIATVAACRGILEMMRTPDDIIDGAYSYIVVIFLGIPVTYLYNLLAGIIRALGDSKTPVFFLVIAASLNIVLDLLFIIVFHMGISGAAWATVISQGVSGILCLFYMTRKFEVLKISREEWRADKHLMATLCNMGVPMGLQYSITAIGSVVLQSAVNTLGSVAVASVTAASKVSLFMMCPFDAMGSTMATYGGQNVGAGRLERLGKGMKACMTLGAVYSVLALAVVLTAGKYLLMLFVDGGEIQIINNATRFLTINVCCYILLAVVNIFRFMIQGIGFPKFAVLAGVFEMVARAFVGFVLVPIFGFGAACFGNPFAWLLADFFLVPAYFHVCRKLKMLFETREEKTEEKARISG